MSIKGGAQLTELSPGKWRDAGLLKGFVITAIDKIAIVSAQQLEEVMAEKGGGNPD